MITSPSSHVPDRQEEPDQDGSSCVRDESPLFSSNESHPRNHISASSLPSSSSSLFSSSSSSSTSSPSTSSSSGMSLFSVLWKVILLGCIALVLESPSDEDLLSAIKNGNSNTLLHQQRSSSSSISSSSNSDNDFAEVGGGDTNLCSPSEELSKQFLSAPQSGIRLLLIGDSVDRFLLFDWCRAAAHRSLCTHVPESHASRATAHYNRRPPPPPSSSSSSSQSQQQPSSSSTSSLEEQIEEGKHPFTNASNYDECEEFDVRIGSLNEPLPWLALPQPAMCHDPELDISIAMIWHPLGVNPLGPWLVRYGPGSGEPGVNFARSETDKIAYPTQAPHIEYEPSQFKYVQRALISGIAALGEPPTAILAQSLFWDLRRMSFYEPDLLRQVKQDHHPASTTEAKKKKEEEQEQEEMGNDEETLRDIQVQWESSWGNNMTLWVRLVDDVLQPYQSSITWKGWRTSSYVDDRGDMSFDADWRIGANVPIQLANARAVLNIQNIGFTSASSSSSSSSTTTAKKTKKPQRTKSRTFWHVSEFDVAIGPNPAANGRLRDKHHPRGDILAEYVDNLLLNVSRCE